MDSRVARRRKQAELLKRGLDLKAIAGGTGGGSAKTKRFWREVHVKSVDGTWNSSSCVILIRRNREERLGGTRLID